MFLMRLNDLASMTFTEPSSPFETKILPNSGMKTTPWGSFNKPLSIL